MGSHPPRPYTNRYNPTMPVSLEQLDAIMERASHALADMDYLECEALCLEALGLARQAGRYGYYARVLLPLQEARRQRRMIAVTGVIQIGSGDTGFDTERWLTGCDAGCILLTHPHSAKDALNLSEQARQQKLHVEVLYADSTQDDKLWTLQSYAGPSVACRISPPSKDSDLARWFINATERLGDAALQNVDDTLTGKALVQALEARLNVFPDHELLHQRLAAAARAVH